ncbi:MAG: Gx transporter family protein [Spirochaetaceae bacterium]|jgi:heptaprenyl diphosphate synthase|nr:Gx transporter family protein [Spirochaetaceae bacterium]
MECRENFVSPNGQRLVPFLAALALFLSTLEYLIPKPLPILRLGLANLPLLLALAKLRAPDYFLLALLKVLGQALVSGTLFSYVFLFSAAGTFAASAAMWVLYHIAGTSLVGFIGLSVAGALGNNAAQIALGRFFLFGEGTRYIAPVLLIAGTVTGVGLGLFAERFTAMSKWYAALPEKLTPQRFEWHKKGGKAFLSRRTLAAGVGFAAALGIFAAVRNPVVLGVLTVALAVAVRLRRGRVRVLPALSAAACVVFFAVLAPYGKVLVRIGPLAVTSGALFSGVRRAEILVGMVFLSQLVLSGFANRAALGRPARDGGETGLLTAVFAAYGRITAEGIPIRRGKILEGLDKRLWESCYESGCPHMSA